MQKLVSVFIGIIVLQISSFSYADIRPDSFADLSERLIPAVVNISSTQKMDENGLAQQIPEFPEGSPFKDFFEQFMGQQESPFPARPQTSLGSGFIIDAQKGYVITNNHVIADADKIQVILHDDTKIEATIIGRDKKTDIAILQIKTNKKLTDVRLGNSDPMRVGDWVLAIGNPFGLGGTVTAGIISARQRDIHAGPYDDFIQTDASINQGNSGGPMFNLDGDVIGINTAIFSPNGGSIGIGFAIPVNLVKPVVNQLIKYGKTRRGWLGVRIQEVSDEMAESLDLPKTMGAMVADVTPKGPAEKSGFKRGDIILLFNGREISQMRELPLIVAETEIGISVDVIFWRDGKKRKVKVKVAELEKAEESGLLEQAKSDGSPYTPLSKETDIDLLGLTLGFEENDIIITNISNDSQALEKGLNIGDVVREINRKAISSPKQAKAIVTGAKKNGKKSVLLLVESQGIGQAHFVALKLIKKDKKPKKTN